MRKSEISERDFYDVWLPTLAPSQELVAMGRSSQDESSWKEFRRRFRGEMNGRKAARMLDLLAACSHHMNFSLGCYCEHETRCHRSVLRELLAERGAAFHADIRA